MNRLHRMGTLLTKIFWGVWVIVGLLTALVTRRESTSSRRENVLHSMILWGAIFVNIENPPKRLGGIALPQISGRSVRILGLTLEFLGILTAFWARVSLGRNWSASIQRRSGHQIVTSGPYQFIRHPIYTAISLLLFGLFLTRPRLAGLIGCLGAGASFARQAEQEETFLTEEFGEEYSEYIQRTARFIPGLY